MTAPPVGSIGEIENPSHPCRRARQAIPFFADAIMDWPVSGVRVKGRTAGRIEI
jgi:hypothetical protein